MRNLREYGDWLGVGELATYWEVSDSLIYAMVDDGSIDPVVRLGPRGQIRVPAATILRMEGRPNESDGITEVKSPNTTEPDAVAVDAPEGRSIETVVGATEQPGQRSHGVRAESGVPPQG